MSESEAKKQWKDSLIDLLLSEPPIGKSKHLSKKGLLEYLNQLEEKSDPYYGISTELVIAIEKHLEL